jgi:hypothetical protein
MTVSPDAGAGPGSAVAAVPLTIASRPQKRYSTVQTVSNLSAATSFPVFQLSATGWVRRIKLLVTATYTTSGTAAVVAGDGPWNLLSAITLTDATGQPICQPISGYNLYLVNKYFPAGGYVADTYSSVVQYNPHVGSTSTYNYAVATTAGSATFRLSLDLEQDPKTGYGSVPNLDSNASLQLKVDVAATTVAFSGATASAATVSLRVSQEYYAPVASSMGGAPVHMQPPGAGDYTEIKYETQPVSAAAENLVALTNRGGLIKGVLLISRASGTRTAPTAAANLGILLDNQPLNEGIPIEEHYDDIARAGGHFGALLTTSYAPLTSGVAPGLDTGVVPLDFQRWNGYRDAWLSTRTGSLFQVRFTPGASATTLEVVTVIMQARDPNVFYARS